MLFGVLICVVLIRDVAMDEVDDDYIELTLDGKLNHYFVSKQYKSIRYRPGASWIYSAEKAHKV